MLHGSNKLVRRFAQQISNGDELVAEIAQDRYDGPRRGSRDTPLVRIRQGIAVVQEQNRSISGLPENRLAYRCDGNFGDSPVGGVHVPSDDCVAACVQAASLPRCQPPPRWAVQQRALAQHRCDRLFCAIDVPGVFDVEAAAAFVAVGVIGDHMACLIETLHDVRVGTDVLADAKERAWNLQLAEHIDQPFGRTATGAVVECEGEPPFPSRPMVDELAESTADRR